MKKPQPEVRSGLEMERAKRFELSTTTLARWSSTTELRSLKISLSKKMVERGIRRIPPHTHHKHRVTRNLCSVPIFLYGINIGFIRRRI